MEKIQDVIGRKGVYIYDWKTAIKKNFQVDIL